MINEYLRQHRVRKLHLGCGRNILDGWLNSDNYPVSEQVVRIDATDQFPLEDAQFDYVFSEHMIEHLSYEQGARMLGECHRVLKPGGKLRISTPDLAFLIDLYTDEPSALQRDYLRWATSQFIDHAPRVDKVFVINNFVRDWGHTFIYNEDILRDSLERAGFSDIVSQVLNRSDDPALCDLENETRMPAGFLALESFTLEARR